MYLLIVCTELELASLGYKDTIVLRPITLTGGLKEEPGLVNKSLRQFLDLSRKLTIGDIHIATVAKAVRNAGVLGSSGLPDVAEATKLGPAGASFTCIENKGIEALAKVGA